MNTTNQKNQPWRQSGFTLAEVTLTLGIVAFAVVTLLGLLGTLLDADSSVTDRRAAIQAIDSLHQYLEDGQPFDTIFEWAVDGTALAYATYRSNADGDPDTSSKSVRSLWLDESNLDTYNDADTNYESARESNWLKIRLTLDEDLNPVASVVSGEADDYEHAYLVFRAEVYNVANPELRPWELDPPARPVYSAPVTALR